jgi:predicted Zn-dependent protease
LDAGKTGEAVQAIEQALTLCKTDARFYVSLARARVAQARPDEARQALREMSVCCLSIPESVGKAAAALERQLGATVRVRP